MQARLRKLGLAEISHKLESGVRLTFDDGLTLFSCPDTLALGWLVFVATLVWLATFPVSLAV